MDPEVQRQLEEQAAQLANAFSQVTASIIGSNQSQNNSVKGVSAGTAAWTKSLSDAAKKADDGAASIKAAFGDLKTTLKKASGEFASAMFSGTEGFEKYNKSITTAGSSVASFASNFGAYGAAVGAAIEAMTILSTLALKNADAMTGLRDGLSKVVGVLPLSIESLTNLSIQAGYSGANMAKLQKITGGLGEDLTSLGATAGEGAEKFMKMSDVTDETRKRFNKLGVSQEQLTQYQANYIETMNASGRGVELQTKSVDELRNESLKYADNIIRLSSLTGKSGDQIKAEQKAALSTFQEKATVFAEETKMAKLRQEAENATDSATKEAKLAQVAQMQKEMKVREDSIGNLTATLGPQMGDQLSRVMREGVYDSVSQPLANLGVDFIGYSKKLKEASPEEAVKIQQKLTDEVAAAYKKKSVDLEAILKMPDGEEIAKKQGFNKETMDRVAKYANLTGKEREEALKADQKQREADKGLADQKAELDKIERDAGKVYAKLMNDLTQAILPPLMEGFAYFSTDILPVVSDAFKFFSDNVLPPIVDLFKELSPTLKILWDAFKLISGFLLGGFLGVIKDITLVFKGLNVILKPLSEIFDKLMSKLGSLLGFSKAEKPAAAGPGAAAPAAGAAAPAAGAAAPAAGAAAPAAGAAAAGPGAAAGNGKAGGTAAEVIIGNEKRSGGTMSWRTNNPGNNMYGPLSKSAGAIGSVKAKDGEDVAIFPTLADGLKMQVMQWRRPKYNSGTIGQGVSTWTAGNQGPDSTYAKDLAKAAGATTDTLVSKLSDSALTNLAEKQKIWEGFKPGKVTQAKNGGVFDGPVTGYPMELHGKELVAPIDPQSILMKLAKTPADKAPSSAEKSSQSGELATLQQIAQMIGKLIAVTEDNHGISKKMLQAART